MPAFLIVALAAFQLLAGVCAGDTFECHVQPAPPGQYATQALQEAISACGRAGGTVRFAPGAYLTGAVVASGSVALHLPPGATLLAGTQRVDYPGGQPDWYLLAFRNCTACCLYGGGQVEGQGAAWVVGQVPGDRKRVRNWRDPSCRVAEECRPRLVGVLDSSEVEIAGVSLADPIYWGLHILRSSRVQVRGVNISSDWDIPNTDGIDIDSSTDVEVSGCRITTADDAVCLKTTSAGRPTEHVRVQDCTLQSRSSAVKLGSESRAAFRDISFTNLTVLDSHRGLAVQLRDEGSVHSVAFSNITLSTRYYNSTWWGGAEPIYVTAALRTDATRVGSVRSISFHNIHVAAAENGIFVAGAAGAPVTGLSISRLQLHMARRSSWPGGAQDYRPGVRGLVRSGTTAPVWVEQAQRVLLEDVEVIYHAPFRQDWELALRVDARSAGGLTLRRFSIRVAEEARGLRMGDPEEAGASAAAAAAVR